MGYSFVVFADGCANLPQAMLEGIKLIPDEYLMEDVPQVYLGDVDHFDGKSFYDQLRSGKVAKTSLLNTHLFETHFRPELEQGNDIIYVSMSSGISGTYNAAKIAADELMEEFPGRFIHIVDSHGCGFGNGLLAVKAAALAKDGVDVKEAAAIVDDAVPHTCQYFTVDEKYAAIILGACPHKVAGLGDWSSLIEKCKQDPTMPMAFDARSISGELKVTKESFKTVLSQICSMLMEARKVA